MREPPPLPRPTYPKTLNPKPLCLLLPEKLCSFLSFVQIWVQSREMSTLNPKL